MFKTASGVAMHCDVDCYEGIKKKAGNIDEN